MFTTVFPALKEEISEKYALGFNFDDNVFIRSNSL